MYVIFVHICCRAPRGACGLKYIIQTEMDITGTSRPARGVWIEMAIICGRLVMRASRPARGVWIEMCVRPDRENCSASRPARGVWIEIVCILPNIAAIAVAPREGRVD